ncbi:MAG: hypothetical protein LBU61_01415 [Coriobacteriales bacterium]|jgi:hypothetical protein|nr:hypothetical protein [Coriobacteriales bacterium]
MDTNGQPVIDDGSDDELVITSTDTPSEPVESTPSASGIESFIPYRHVAEILLFRRRHQLLTDRAELTCVVQVQCLQACDLTGLEAVVRSEQTGEELVVPLETFNGMENETAEFCLYTGVEPGRYSWTATFSNIDPAGKSHPEISFTMNFDYAPHTIGLAVWDVPMVFVGDEQLCFKAGAKCSNGCPLNGLPLLIKDSTGTLVNTVFLGNDFWPGSDGLFWAEVTIPAPLTAGLHSFFIEAEGSQSEGELEAFGHLPVSWESTVLVSAKPDCTINLLIVDKTTGYPIVGAKATCHPYRAESDVDGRLEIPANAGMISMMVQAEGYERSITEVLINGDADLTIEMDLKPVYLEDM